MRAKGWGCIFTLLVMVFICLFFVGASYASAGTTVIGKGLSLLDDVAKIAARYGDDVAKVVSRNGDDAVRLLERYGDDGARFLAQYGDDGVRMMSRYGDDLMKMSWRGKAALARLDESVTESVMRAAIAHGDDAVAMLARQGIRAQSLTEKALDAGWDFGLMGELFEVIGRYGEKGLQFLERNWKGIIAAGGVYAFIRLQESLIDTGSESLGQIKEGVITAGDTFRDVMPVIVWFGGIGVCVLIGFWVYFKIKKMAIRA